MRVNTSKYGLTSITGLTPYQKDIILILVNPSKHLFPSEKSLSSKINPYFKEKWIERGDIINTLKKNHQNLALLKNVTRFLESAPFIEERIYQRIPPKKKKKKGVYYWSLKLENQDWNWLFKESSLDLDFFKEILSSELLDKKGLQDIWKKRILVMRNLEFVRDRIIFEYNDEELEFFNNKLTEALEENPKVKKSLNKINKFMEESKKNSLFN